MKKGFITLPVILGVCVLAITGILFREKITERLGAELRVLIVPQGGTGASRFASGTLIYGNDTSALMSTSSPVVGAIYATSTTATSTFTGVKVHDGFQVVDRPSCSGTSALNTDSSGFLFCGAVSAVLTPWTSDIDADGYDLSDVANITATSGIWTIGTTSPAFSRPFAVQGGGFFAGNLTGAHIHATGSIIALDGIFASGTAMFGGLVVSAASSTLLNISDLTATDATATTLSISGSLNVIGASSSITNLVMVNATSTSATTTNLYVSSSAIITGASTTIAGVLDSSTIINASGIFASGTGAYNGLFSLYSGIQSVASSTLLNVVNFSGTNATTSNLYVSAAGMFNTASSTFTNRLNVNNLVSVSGLFASGSLAVSGLSSLYGGVIVNGSSTASANLNVSGVLNASSTINVAGIVSVSSSTLLNVSNYSGTNATMTALYVSGALQGNGPSSTITQLITVNSTSTNLAYNGSLLALGASSTITNLDVSTALQVPNAAGCTTVDALGELCIDDTSNTLNFYDGTTERVLNPKRMFSLSLASTTPYERISLGWTVDYAWTVSEVKAKMACMATTSPSAAFCAGGYSFNLSHGANQNSTSTLMSENSGQLVNTISTSSMTSHSTFNDATIAANEEWFFYTMAASSSNDTIVVEVFGFQDP